MEIEFNPGRYSEPGVSQSVTRRPPPTAASDALSIERAQSVRRALAEAPAVRPEKVEQARAYAADVKYPPEEVLERLSHLLALKLKGSE
ncbi:MAG: hypothetical protein RMN51_01970 [Verrucomicrobiota bacterium]|nr:hypothetical protein [Verrucomicrobiota bacterium]